MDSDSNQYITPLAQNDPRLFTNVSQAFSLVDLGKRLLDAAKNGDVDEVKNLLEGGAPFTTDWLGISPLHFSAMNGHLTTCEALLKAGISRDARTKVDRTPLHLAAQEGHADIVDLLLKSGADLEAKDMLQMTALHWAAERGHAPVVQVLMHHGANSCLKNKFEMTPMDIAEFKDNSDALDAMLHTHFDTATSSVGKMAAPGEDLVNADAFILTDEETLIPAAPPADEVTVSTAINSFEEFIPLSDGGGLDPSRSVADFSDSTTHVSPSHNYLNAEDCSKQTLTDWIIPQNTECVVDRVISEPAISRNGQHSPVSVKCYNSQYVGEQGSGGLFFNSKLRDAIPLPLPVTESDVDLEDLSENMMVVETPDGRILYVRQEGDFDSPKLAIFSEDGTQIHDQNLLAQVVNAIANFPAETFERENNLDFQSSMNGFTSMNTSLSSKPQSEFRSGDSSNYHAPLLDELDFTHEVSNIIEDVEFSHLETGRDDLLSQLSQFAADHSQVGNSISVDGVSSQSYHLYS